MPTPLLELRSISKQFPGVRALDAVDLAIAAGEIVGLVGENGAGKSTLIKIIGGIYRPNDGQLLLDGSPVTFPSVRDSLEAGIRLIHQELHLAESLSIAENLFLGRQPYRFSHWLPVTHRRQMAAKAEELLHRVGLAQSPWCRVADLSIGQQQLVEIAKALAGAARLLVFDEPTSSLSTTDADRLIELIRSLRRAGTTILYISHRLAEVKALADRVVVLRDGRRVGELIGKAIEHDRMVSLMVGRDLRQYFRQKAHHVRTGEALRVTDLRLTAAEQPINFHINRGEIVGLAGLVGAGRTELARALFGVDAIASGRIEVAPENGLENRRDRTWPRNPGHAIARGLFLVPEERKTQGLLLNDSVGDNITLAALPRLARLLLRNRRAERRLVRQQIPALSIRATSPDQRVLTLSGGNQQKVVLARWLALEPQVLILDEPTRGIDVGSKSEIYGLLFDLAERGVGILVISSEMEELLGVCDRILVMRAHAIQGELTGSAMTEENILRLAIGENKTGTLMSE
jgi:ribose transport system ATP-binding protein